MCSGLSWAKKKMIRITFRNSQCERRWPNKERGIVHNNEYIYFDVSCCMQLGYMIWTRCTQIKSEQRSRQCSGFANQTEQWQKISTEIDRNKINNALTTTATTIPPLAVLQKKNILRWAEAYASAILDLYSLRSTLFCFAFLLLCVFVLVFYVFSWNDAIVSKVQSRKTANVNVCVRSRIVNGAATVSLNTPSNTTYHEQQKRTTTKKKNGSE